MHLAKQRHLGTKITLILKRRNLNHEVWSLYGTLSDSSYEAKTGASCRDDSSELKVPHWWECTNNVPIQAWFLNRKYGILTLHLAGKSDCCIEFMKCILSPFFSSIKTKNILDAFLALFTKQIIRGSNHWTPDSLMASLISHSPQDSNYPDSYN